MSTLPNAVPESTPTEARPLDAVAAGDTQTTGDSQATGDTPAAGDTRALVDTRALLGCAASVSDESSLEIRLSLVQVRLTCICISTQTIEIDNR